MVRVVIDLIINVSFQDEGQLDLRMPMPEKGAALVGKERLVAHIYRESKGSVVFYFPAFLISLNLHRIPQYSYGFCNYTCCIF